MFHSFLVLEQGRGTYLSFRFISDLPYCQSKRQVLFFSLLTITKSGWLRLNDPLVYSLRDFYGNLRDSKSPQNVRTFLSIPADLSKIVVWMVAILPLISNSSNLLSKPLVTVPSKQTTSGITATLMLHRLIIFSSLIRSKYFPIFSLSFIFSSEGRWKRINPLVYKS